MKAIVTGASSGIGRAISKTLLKEHYEVYGIGRDFSKTKLQDEHFHPLILDLLEEENTKKQLSLLDWRDCSLLVNNAGCAYYGLHETLNSKEIQEMCRLNLEVPMVLTNRFLKTIRLNKGTIINIASICGTHSATHAASYGATKAGLIAFSKSLFEENRKYDVKVSCIIPDNTATNLYRNTDFEPDSSEGSYLTPEDIAEAVEYILHINNTVVCNEIVLRPQYNRITKKNSKSF